MGYPAKNEYRRYAYGEYLTWLDNERWEFIACNLTRHHPSNINK